MINKFIFCQDGESPSLNSAVKPKLDSRELIDMFNLGYGDAKNNSLRNGNINFVGLIIYKNNALVSVPKHYTNDITKMDIKKNKFDLILILKAMIKAHINNDKDYSGINSKHYIGYPFTNAWFIYKYYKKFGIYKRSNIKLRKGYYGKVSWNKTIKWSNMYLTKNGPIFLPFVIKDKQSHFNLISYCMDTILQYTLKLFQKFLPILSWHYIPQFRYYPQLFKYKKIVISKLKDLSCKTFNERTEFLIKNIIMFLKSLGRERMHTNIRVSGPYNQVWEDAVNVYLETKLDLHRTIKYKIPWLRLTPLSHPNKFDHPGKLIIGELYPEAPNKKHLVELEPDHCWPPNSNKYRLIFDSKYYKTLKELDMKQVVYQIYFYRIRHMQAIINSLVLPTEHSSVILKYFCSKQKNVPKYQRYTIWATYLNTKCVLTNYVRSSVLK